MIPSVSGKTCRLLAHHVGHVGHGHLISFLTATFIKSVGRIDLMQRDIAHAAHREPLSSDSQSPPPAVPAATMDVDLDQVLANEAYYTGRTTALAPSAMQPMDEDTLAQPRVFILVVAAGTGGGWSTHPRPHIFLPRGCPRYSFVEVTSVKFLDWVLKKQRVRRGQLVAVDERRQLLKMPVEETRGWCRVAKGQENANVKLYTGDLALRLESVKRAAAPDYETR
ncbi:hypothetical protein B0H16DRAFT_1476139 [Mycena metata]|uniref:Uncharacterized protein n=1 Tax=Mycena metata TaxID=1033252 RepID=A0AAD7HCT0_9AGAR|nr:hypothetical protein B0H16DRAFT_1476139 [Mycena metata]